MVECFLVASLIISDSPGTSNNILHPLETASRNYQRDQPSKYFSFPCDAADQQQSL